METIKKYRDMQWDTIKKLYPLWMAAGYPNNVPYEEVQKFLVRHTKVYNYNLCSFIHYMINNKENEEYRAEMEKQRAANPILSQHQLLSQSNNTSSSNNSDYDDLPF